MKNKFNLIFFLLCISLAGLIFRFAFVWEVGHHSTLNVAPQNSDLYNYDLMAKDLLQDQPIGLRMIGYPPFIQYMKMFYQLIGTSPLAFYIHQYLLSVLCAFLLYRIGSLYWGRLAGMFTALLFIFYKMNYLYDVIRIHTVLSQFLIIAVLYFFCMAKERKTFSFYAVFLISGLFLCLLRSFFWPLFGMAVCYLFIENRQWRYKKYILLNIAFVILAYLGFYQLHGTDAYLHKFSVHFYIGNHSETTGLLAPIEGIRTHASGFAKDTALMAFKETGRRDKISSYWMNKTFDSYKKKPFLFFKVIGRKIRLLANNYEPHNNASIYFYEYKTRLKYYPRLDYAVIFAFAVLGILLLFKKKHKGRFLILPVFFLCALIFSIFFCSRYRMPVIPFFCLFAGFGISGLIEVVKDKKYPAVLVCLTLVVLMLIFSYSKIPLLAKEKDIQFWEKREKRKARIQTERQKALKDYRLFETLGDIKKIQLTKKLGSYGLIHEFFEVADEACQLAEKKTDKTMLLFLLKKKADLYEEAFMFDKSLDVWQRLESYEVMQAIAEKKIEEMHTLGILFDPVSKKPD